MRRRVQSDFKQWKKNILQHFAKIFQNTLLLINITFVRKTKIKFMTSTSSGYLLDSWYLDQPAQVITVHIVSHCPLREFLPLLPVLSIHRYPQLHILILALHKVIQHFLDTTTHTYYCTYLTSQYTRYLNQMCIILPSYVIVSFKKYFTETTFTYVHINITSTLTNKCYEQM